MLGASTSKWTFGPRLVPTLVRARVGKLSEERETVLTLDPVTIGLPGSRFASSRLTAQLGEFRGST